MQATKDTRRKDPKKRLAMQLAHAMDDFKQIGEGYMYPNQEEEAKKILSEINLQIFKNGYDFEMMLDLAEEYKKLSMVEYFEWMAL